MRFSIVTATFNSEAVIDDMLLSLNQQDFDDLEHIIVDGNSTDDTVRRIRSLSRFGPSIRVEDDFGVYNALNKGILRCNGEYVMFLHSDDFFASNNILSDLDKMIELYEPDVIYGDLAFVSRNNTSQVTRFWKSGLFTQRKLDFGWMAPHPTFIVKRDLYIDHGLFDERFAISADYEHMIRLLSLGNLKVHYFPKLVTIMKQGGVSTNFKNVTSKLREDYMICRLYFKYPSLVLTLKLLRKVLQFKHFNFFS